MSTTIVGKTYTMLGVDDCPQSLGVIPCAISWLYKLVDERKHTTGARFSVRVSAVEVTGKTEVIKDLLADITGNGKAIISCVTLNIIGLSVLRTKLICEYCYQFSLSLSLPIRLCFKMLLLNQYRKQFT